MFRVIRDATVLVLLGILAEVDSLKSYLHSDRPRIGLQIYGNTHEDLRFHAQNKNIHNTCSFFKLIT